MTPSIPQPVKQLAERLVELAEAMDAFADKHTERLDYERHTSLIQQAVELRTAAAILTVSDPTGIVAGMIADAQDHLSYVRELFEEGGAS